MERWTPACFSLSLSPYPCREGEVSEADLSDRQLLLAVRAAVREKDLERAKPLFAEYAERSVVRLKAKVANDVV